MWERKREMDRPHSIRYLLRTEKMNIHKATLQGMWSHWGQLQASFEDMINSRSIVFSWARGHSLLACNSWWSGATLVLPEVHQTSSQVVGEALTNACHLWTRHHGSGSWMNTDAAVGASSEKVWKGVMLKKIPAPLYRGETGKCHFAWSQVHITRDKPRWWNVPWCHMIKRALHLVVFYFPPKPTNPV